MRPMRPIHSLRPLLVALPLLFAVAGPAQSQISVGIGLAMPGIDIGINMPAYPQLVPVPGYPVYYDPSGGANYFFYDGLYWVYSNDNWYSSGWYNGPWQQSARDSVPLFVLRVPVRYYRQPPPYFQGWRADAAPQWGEHWGPAWASQHHDWDHWDHQHMPRPAPLPAYQRNYSGAHYPHDAKTQREVQTRNYHYQPHEPVAQQHAPKSSTERPAQEKADSGPKAASTETHERTITKSHEQPAKPEAQHHASKSSAERPAQGKHEGGPKAAGAEEHEGKDSKN